MRLPENFTSQSPENQRDYLSSLSTKDFAALDVDELGDLDYENVIAPAAIAQQTRGTASKIRESNEGRIVIFIGATFVVLSFSIFVSNGGVGGAFAIFLAAIGLGLMASGWLESLKDPRVKSNTPGDFVKNHPIASVVIADLLLNKAADDLAEKIATKQRDQHR